jgi:putative peptidoglycan lipid II flippase
MIAAVGPVAAACAQFLLSIVLLSRLGIADFGRVSFIIILAQFGIGLGSALFSAPLLVAAAQDGDGPHSVEIRGIVAAALAAAAPAAAIVAAVGWLIGLDPLAATLFAGHAALVLLRQFARAWSLAFGSPKTAMLSDLLYAACLLLGTGGLLLARALAPWEAALPLLAALAAGLAPFRDGTLAALLPRLRPADLGGYRAVWRRDARWSSLGVLSTEATVNGHSYVVAAVFGAAAFGPIAATALLIRPATVAINALVEFERARFAHALARRDLGGVRSARRHLHAALLAVWAITAAGAALVVVYASDLLFHDKLDQPAIVTGTLLWFGVALARVLHAPEGAVLQAGGRFRRLASISVWTALISLVAVGLAAALGGPRWSIAGIIAGEGCYALVLHVATRRFLRALASDPALPPG